MIKFNILRIQPLSWLCKSQFIWLQYYFIGKMQSYKIASQRGKQL